jgi:hypothetical protein
MPISKFLAYGLLFTGLVSANADKENDVEKILNKESQRRRDLQEQGPMSKKEAEFVRKLISKDVLRIANKPDDLKAQREPLSAHNPFDKALGQNKDTTPKNDTPNGRRSRGARRAQESDAMTSHQRALGSTQRKGSKKNGNKGGDDAKE